MTDVCEDQACYLLVTCIDLSPAQVAAHRLATSERIGIGAANAPKLFL